MALAVANYHEFHGSLPPPYFADRDGSPMHSWRVLLLPFLAQEDLYRQYDFAEPWNGPNNSRLGDQLPEGIYSCPAAKVQRHQTNYVAVVGASTAWPTEKAISMRDIRDGTSRTVLFVEIADSDIHWMKPRDLRFDGMSFRINDRTAPSIGSYHPGGALVALADASRPFLRNDVDPEVVRGMLTIDGNEKKAFNPFDY